MQISHKHSVDQKGPSTILNVTNTTPYPFLSNQWLNLRYELIVSDDKATRIRGWMPNLEVVVALSVDRHADAA